VAALGPTAFFAKTQRMMGEVMRNNTFMEFGRLGRQGVLLAALAIAFLGVLVALIPQTAYAASEKEPNNSAQQATAMTLGNSYSGAISSSSDEDWFKVTLPSAGKFTLSLGHNYKKDYGRWDVKLYAADKATELHSESWSNKSTGTDSFTMGLKAGTYYVRVDDYGWGSTVAGETYTLKVDRALNHASLSLKKSTVEYTGKSLKPTVTVKCAGAKLKKGRDYTVSYSSNKNIGTATITVKGKGQYAGASKSCTFKIVPKGTSIKKAKSAKKSFSVSVKKQTKQTTGYQLRYSTKKSMKGAKIATFKNAKKTTLKVKKLKSKKTYYVQVRTYKKIGGTTYASPWSKTVKVKTK